MAIWCGQCQARNDGQAERCAVCGAPLRPVAGSRPSRPSAGALESAPTGKAAAHPRLYDSRWLERVIAEQLPERPDLTALAARCRVSVHTEVEAAGLVRRHFFLPKRTADSLRESFVLLLPGVQVVVDVVEDPRYGRAIHCVEQTSRPIAASEAVKIAQYERLRLDMAATRRHLVFLPALAILFIAFALYLSSMPVGPAGQSPSAPSLAYLPLSFSALVVAGATAQLIRLNAALEKQRAAVDLAELAFGLPNFSYAPSAAPLAALMVALSAICVWLAIRAVYYPPFPVPASGSSEPVLVVIAACLLYPAGASFSKIRHWLTIRAAVRELERAQTEGRPAKFEPWLKFSDYAPRGV